MTAGALGAQWTGRERWHGTVPGYRDRGCRCERCRAAVTTVTGQAEREQIARDREAADHERTLRSQYRQGARTRGAVEAHNRETTEWRRSQLLAHFVGDAEERILAMLADGRDLQVVAAKFGMTSRNVLRRAEWDHEWRRRLDEATTAGRDPAITHGSAYSYRFYGCRCPECREAKRVDAGPRRKA